MIKNTNKRFGKAGLALILVLALLVCGAVTALAAPAGGLLQGDDTANKAALVTGVTGPVFDAAGDIGEDAAVAAALAWDGLPVDIGDATPRVRADYDDGRYHYDVTFEADGYGYEYEIDPATGELLSLQIEKLYTAPAGSGGDIGRDAAITAALDHAGVAAGDVTWSECKKDTDDGRLEYEVDFRAGGMEYEYTIDAASGAVLSFDREIAD